MITTALLAFLGALLAVVLFQMFRGGKQAGSAAAQAAATAALPARSPSGANVDLMQAKPGDVISIPGAAADFSDVDFTVDRRSAYEYMNRRWTDLSGDFRGQRVYLEVQGAGELDAMVIVDPRQLTPPELGTTEAALADFDARQDPTAALTFEGRQWQYESSREIGYFENETGDGEGLYRWTFRDTAGNRVLLVEKWEGEPFEARVAQRMNPRDLTVFRAA
ncbi:MAG: DUF4178 domain-containing protein [Bryobacteraceae bacterium]|nr:DUF4178 domain-containing protein [Bryobacteraceae bacterium]